MSKGSSYPLNLKSEPQRQLLLPAVIVGQLVFGSLIVHGLVSGLSTREGTINLTFGLSGLIFMAAIALWSGPLLTKKPWLGWVLAVVLGLFLGLIELNEHLLLPGTAIPLSLTFITILALGSGRWPTYLFVIIAIGFNLVDLRLGSSVNIPLFILETIMVPVMAVVATETILRLRKSLLRETKHLETLNRVARSLATSLEMHQVVGLVSSAIQNALDADTYYVGLLNGDSLHMELFFDDGIFYPEMDIPLKETLAGIVIQSGESLMISDLVSERKKRNLPFIIVGRPRPSSSWIGTPLETDRGIIGLIAVASYQKFVFDKSDLNLLENIAQQAGLALNNADRHSEVETRSQHDSLTKVLNHNAFLARLERQVRESTIAKFPLSLIMLDVDDFKKYNDIYGHLTGDEVLTTLCQVIRRNIKKGDLVGRWGGEEFVIALPNATAPQAYGVAERIRVVLAAAVIHDRHGNNIPSPTVSQGIAEYKVEIGDYIHLVDLADQRLYIAKERGRSEIEPFFVEPAEQFSVDAANKRPESL